MNPKRHVAFFAALIFVNSIIADHLHAQQPDSIYRLPAGTRISVKLDAEINSKVASVNDTFIAFVAKPVINRDTVVVPVGTEIEGRVTEVTRASSGGDNGDLEVTFESLKIGTSTRRIDGVIARDLRAPSSRTFSLASILGGIAVGAIAGGVSNGGRGGLIGAGLGAGVGTAIALARKGKQARLRKGEEFEIELKREVVLPAIGF